MVPDLQISGKDPFPQSRSKLERLVWFIKMAEHNLPHTKVGNADLWFN